MIASFLFSDRWIHLPSGRTYSYSFSPPLQPGKDDLTGEALVQRNDDTIAAFRERMLHFHAHLNEIKHFYSQKRMLYTFSGPDSLSIYNSILTEAAIKKTAKAAMAP